MDVHYCIMPTNNHIGLRNILRPILKEDWKTNITYTYGPKPAPQCWDADRDFNLHPTVMWGECITQEPDLLKGRKDMCWYGYRPAMKNSTFPRYE